VVDSLAYLADGSGGLRIINVSNPTNPVEVGFYDTGSSAHGVYVFNGLAYVADGRDGLYIIRYTGKSGIEEKNIAKEGISILNIHSGINIRYSLKVRENVKAEIYNALGQRIAKLMDEIRPVGRYTIRWNGNSGIYFVRIEIGDKVYREKAIILK